MYEYMHGNIRKIYDTFVILETNNIGYKIYLTNTKKLKCENIILYTYLYQNEAVRLLFGFKERIEKEIFIKLTQMKNIGVKTAFNILSKYSYNQIIDAIFTLDKKFLLNLPKITNNNVDFLIKKLSNLDVLDKESINPEFINALRSLEYSDVNIYEAYKKIDKTMNINDQIRTAINILEEGK